MKNKNKKCIVKPTGSNTAICMYTSLCREKKRENFKHSYKPKMDKLWNENTNQFDGISF